MAKIAFQTLMRAAVVQLLTDYKADRELKLQIYPARPASINPPTAFVDGIRERREFVGPTLAQRSPVVDVVVLHGVFDHGDTVKQRDEFVDGFLEWMDERPHQADPNTLIGAVAVADDPTYVPDWLRPELQRTYFATVISVEGFASD